MKEEAPQEQRRKEEKKVYKIRQISMSKDLGLARVEFSVRVMSGSANALTAFCTV